MKVQLVESNGITYGREFIGEGYQVFFGNASCTSTKLTDLFSDFTFRFLKQVHGNNLVAADEISPTADGQHSKSIKEALVIKTADCLPVMIATDQTVYALHCGWRGLENELIRKCAQQIKSLNEIVFGAFIGPHIQAKDFEVGLDVAEILINVYQKVSPASPLPILPHDDPNKRRVNLGQIALAQLRFEFGSDFTVEISRESTFSQPQYHSFRRGKATDARQYSFIVKI